VLFLAGARLQKEIELAQLSWYTGRLNRPPYAWPMFKRSLERIEIAARAELGMPERVDDPRRAADLQAIESEAQKEFDILYQKAEAGDRVAKVRLPHALGVPIKAMTAVETETPDAAASEGS
jgi:hypothetical protein